MGRGKGAYFRTVQPRHANPAVSKNHVPQTNNGRGTPLRANRGAGYTDESHEGGHEQCADEGGPEHDRSSAEALDGRREWVCAECEHGIHDCGEELCKKVRESNILKDDGGVVDREIDA